MRRNALRFLRIMAELFWFSVELPYENRVEALKILGVALWDVLHACVRVDAYFIVPVFYCVIERG